MIQSLHGGVIPVNARLDNAVHSLQKIRAMRLDMEADQIRSQQSIH